MKILIIFISIFFLPASVLSQVVETNPPNDIKTINFGMSDDSFGVPIIGLDEMLILEFDVLNNLEEDFYYVIEHYNYDWTPSQLMKTEYINGMDNLRIVDYINSFNTYQIYSHYQLKIPNQQTRLKVSGNYLIKIFDDYGDLVFSRKFMVQEKISKIQVQVRRPREVSLINEAQSVDFKVSSSNINFNNPMQTVKTVIIQNNNLKTAIYGLKPQFIMGNELVYRFIDESLFMGGNEYLFFENRDVRSANQGVQYIDLKEIYHSYLFTDIQRKYQKYTYNPDINGGFKITVLDREDPRIEADYTYVHFSLLSEEIVNSSVYVFGGFNNFSVDKSNQMSYNFQKGIYELSIMLKQGFYNYKYVVVDEKNDLQEGFISGNFDVTENNYVVVVYYRDLGSRYDKLIGIGSANSVDMTN